MASQWEFKQVGYLVFKKKKEGHDESQNLFKSQMVIQSAECCFNIRSTGLRNCIFFEFEVDFGRS